LVNNQFTRESVGYATQKPKVLIERIIKASSNEGDTVADYYLGSGTTAVVCKELNRNFIGCDINPKAIEITNARLDAVS
jgi:DNA modification methylase